MISGRASDEELHRHSLFLVHKLRYLRFVSRKAYDFGDHLIYDTAATYSPSTAFNHLDAESATRGMRTTSVSRSHREASFFDPVEHPRKCFTKARFQEGETVGE